MSLLVERVESLNVLSERSKAVVNLVKGYSDITSEVIKSMTLTASGVTTSKYVMS